MADDGFGFEGRIAVVQRTRGYRKWPDEVKARIVAESFRAGVRVVDVARRHGVLAHQLSDWRRQARQGLLALPEDVVEGLEAAFVPLAVEPEVSAGAAFVNRLGFTGGWFVQGLGDHTEPHETALEVEIASRSPTCWHHEALQNPCSQSSLYVLTSAQIG